jgi:hypothetical protein
MPSHLTYSGSDLAALEEYALERLESVREPMVRWADSIRPADGAAGRFRWALQTTRGANVAATAYLLGGLRAAGLFDRLVTSEDRKAGIAWVKGLNTGHEQYRDPALLERRTPGWPTSEPWPAPAMIEGINSYARAVLSRYMDKPEEMPPAEPAPGWPNASQAEEKALEWISTRPWYTTPWGGCSHMMRMGTYLLQWHQRGLISLKPLVEAIRFWYQVQDREDGLWGARSVVLQHRINGTFKLFPLIQDQLDLPLPRAERIIDQVFKALEAPDYDATVGGCDEWDNWYVLALAREKTSGYRADDIRRLAAWRIIRVLDLFPKPDGGFSYGVGECQTNWIGFDMSPALPQSDVMGIGLLSAPLNACVEILGLQSKTAWPGKWRMRADQRPAETLRQEIIREVFG